MDKKRYTEEQIAFAPARLARGGDQTRWQSGWWSSLRGWLQARPWRGNRE